MCFDKTGIKRAPYEIFVHMTCCGGVVVSTRLQVFVLCVFLLYVKTIFLFFVFLFSFDV